MPDLLCNDKKARQSSSQWFHSPKKHRIVIVIQDTLRMKNKKRDRSETCLYKELKPVYCYLIANGFGTIGSFGVIERFSC